jgi:hypothetical protein
MNSGKNLEDFFEEKWREAITNGNDELFARLVNSQFYLQQLFMEVSKMGHDVTKSNYNFFLHYLKEYLQKQKDEKIAIVSFNYDSLLESSLYNIFDYEFRSVNDYLFEYRGRDKYMKDILLFKPHGSWNWVHKINADLFESDQKLPIGISWIAKAIYDKKLNYAQLKMAIAPHLSNSAVAVDDIPTSTPKHFHVMQMNEPVNYEYYPSLLLPFKQKDDIIMPQLHTAYLNGVLSNVDEVFIIGWKGTEHVFNTSIGQFLTGKKVKITYVSRSTRTIEEELSKYIFDAEFRWNKSSFSDLISNFHDTKLIPHNPFR